MLKTDETKNLTGSSQIDDKTAAYFNATVSESQTSISMTIADSILYEANKATVRKDYNDFQSHAYALEDKMSTITI
ncbi:MAG: hypothetical protein GX896_08270 [Clostridiales bacterium]|nr:hypothetical protein [Clostridiales bacterium]